jgi:hypothetical protein
MPTTDYAAAIGTDDLVMGYISEAQWGVTPNTGALKLLRLDSEGFSGSKSRTRPAEIDPTGQSSAAITTKEESTGSLNFSVSAGTHNDLIASSLGSAFSITGLGSFGAAGFTGGAATATFTPITFVSGAATLQISAASGSTCTLVASDALFLSTHAPVVAGMKIRISSAGAPTQSGVARVVSVDSTTQIKLADCTWIPAITAAATMAITTIASANTIQFAMTDALFTTTHAVVVGQFVKIYTATGTTNRGIARVKTITNATTLQLDMLSWVPLVAVETGAACGATSIEGQYLRNDIVFNSFTFEKKMAAALYLRYAGSFPTGGSLDVGVGDYLKGTLAFLNKRETTDTAAIAGLTASTAAPNGTIVDSIKGIGTVWRGIDGATAGVPSAINGVVQKIGVKWNKEGAAAQYGIGSSSALGMRSGKQLITGTLSTYFKDFALYNQYINEQAGPISFYALDGLPNVSATKGYVITFCNATIMNPKVVAGGPGQDVMADFEIEGNPDVTGMHGGKTIQIDYFG